jgi:hypothetical protein
MRRLWDFKPQQEPEIEEDLSVYESYKKRITKSHLVMANSVGSSRVQRYQVAPLLPFLGGLSRRNRPPIRLFIASQ